MSTDLYETLMSYAYNNSAEVKDECGCGDNCSHPSGRCPATIKGKCYNRGSCCFNEIYYPENRINARLKYDCKKLVNQYVFRSLDRYASEIYIALKEFNSILQTYEEYKILSLGCGPCTDLIAIDYLNKEENHKKNIKYYGIDLEKTWKEIHRVIKEFPLEDNLILDYVGRYGDVIEILNSDILDNRDFNIITLNYIISSFIADGHKEKVLDLFQSIANYIKKVKTKDCLIIINDVNHPLRGIDLFENIIGILKLNKFNLFNFEKKYFEHSTTVTPFGKKHNNVKTVFGHPVFKNNKCSSAQLIINCGVCRDY